ncbi:acetoacetate--CoA ligase [Pigmentibacter sp. JX0631]|uniref:acetoacetate--CoA ligase n=1 Tax=Pigmentibacter sp. JX0631 TaxID=2976982 RepID=UPI002468FD15|nr:acetoacetate--CoA ligase [Pigmentibacter sp. JX0631]WGL59904.1 acetoacetate--CoA ligase [Pigmentibacter sp. JX0631]
MFKSHCIQMFNSVESECLWEPSAEKIKSANLTLYRNYLNQKYNLKLTNFKDLYLWSIGETENNKDYHSVVLFWQSILEYNNIIHDNFGEYNVLNIDNFKKVEWFPSVKLNFTQNLLKKNDTDLAIVFRGENLFEKKLTWSELNIHVSKMQQFLISIGIQKNDCVAFYVPNIPETITIFLAAASLGAVCSFCSPDFGVQGVLDRFGQIEPKLLVYSDSSIYNGKIIQDFKKLSEIVSNLKSLKNILEINYFNKETDNSDKLNLQKDLKYSNYLSTVKKFEYKEILFPKFAFNHPLFIMYSSGTTGIPKCIVHGTGGTLIQHIKEHKLHCDFKEGDNVFYYTTCGWMMWQWLVSALASNCTIMLYDGSPFSPSPEILFDYIDTEKIRFFGTSAKYIDAIKKSNFIPKKKYSLNKLDIIGSTGSPLHDESFEFVYQNIKKDVCLSSLSGGTDIISCFVLGNPIGKVFKGEIQTPGLGMRVEIFNDLGKSVKGEQGELVCTLPFPSQPIYFWNDPNNLKFYGSYFNKYNNVWQHGDWAEIKSSGGIVIYGRSDATLNPGGVRIGTSDIYRQVEQFEEILECIAVEQKWQNDTRVILFVKLKIDKDLTSSLVSEIKNKLKINCSPRHVPAKIISVPDIPRTRSGKIVETAVKSVINGLEVKNKEAMANPEVLTYYENHPELRLE